MSGDTKKQVIKIREFEWYEVETKVREIMGELLQPFNKKQTEEGIKIIEIKRNIGTITKKLQDHDFLLERQNAQKPSYIELQDKRIEEISKLAIQKQIQNESRLKSMEAIIAVYEEKIKQLNDLQARLDKEIFQRGEDFRKYKGHLDQSLELMVMKQDANLQEISQFKSAIKSGLSKVQTKVIVLDNRVKELEDDSRRKTSDLSKIMDQNMKNNERLIKLDLKTMNLSARVEDRERDSKLSEKFFMKVKQVENDLKFISNYLESYQPLYIQMAISDTLNSYLDGKARRKLCIYEQKKFAKLHHIILVNEKTSLQELMSGYSNNIRKIINRNKKYVTNLAVAESVKYGANIYEFHVEQMNDDEVDESKKAVNIIIPEADIIRIVQQKWVKLEPELKNLLKNEVEPTKNWIKQLQEQTLLRSIQYDKKYEQIKKKIFDYDSQQQLQQKHMSLQLKQVQETTNILKTAFTASKDHIKDILNFSSVINHIVIQDEIDRQGTALYALRSNKTGLETSVNPTIQLDPNCINCENKNSSVINQAFKMACLAYNPSHIRIDQQLFSREEILQISTNILQKLKKKIQNIPDMNRNSNQSIAIKSEIKRRAYSTIKDTSILTSKEDFKARGDSSKGKQMQTLLPLLGASRPSGRQRKAQGSLFY